MYESACIGVASDSVRIVDSDFDDCVIAKHAEFGQSVVVQEFISGEEVGVPIVKLAETCALPPVVFRRSNGMMYGTAPKTFVDENVTHDISHMMFETDVSQYAALQRTAVGAFTALEMRGVGRIDVRIDEDGRAFVFDTNESPPPLGGTAYAVAMASLGFSVVEMLAVWLGVCFRDFGII
jgi:D-alanine-D-alanine ligase-like ATP-grasp enzyme